MKLPTCPRKTSASIAWFAAAMAALGFIPAFEQFHALRPETFAAVFDFKPAAQSADAPDTGAAYGQMIDRSHALDGFYRALARAEAHQPGAVVRILHFGDSPVTADQISADVRELLQGRFGDGGAGFVLIAKPWPWYDHRGIGLSGRGWTIQAASQNYAADGLHGLGGASFEGAAGARAQFEWTTAQQHVEVLYWAQPGGGSLELRSGSAKLGEIATSAPHPGSAYRAFDLPAAAREVELRVLSGRVRLFGVSFENDGPGVRYSNLGLNAAQVATPLRHFEPNHWAEQIRHQRPDLLILNYGANESGYPSYVTGGYEADLRALVREVERAAPESSVLLLAPMDRGTRNSRGEVVTMPALGRLIEIQRRVAADMGCAFFNTFQAMGGEGTMGRWYEMRPRLASSDFMHPLPAGARRVGTLVEAALRQGYLNFKANTSNPLCVRRSSLY